MRVALFKIHQNIWGIMNKETTRLIFLRHGQSLGNLKRRLLGHTNLDLSELGYIQAEQAAVALKDEHIDYIYSSNLIRAYNTAKAHEKYHNLKVIPDPGFREIFLGDWENIDANELIGNNDSAYLIDFRQRFGYFKAPNGESSSELADRIYAHTLTVAARHPGKTLLIGCHAAAIRMLFARILGYDREKTSNDLPFPDNASFSVCEFDGERFSVIEYSNARHISTPTTL